MHPNRAFHWEDRGAMRAFAQAIGFGTLFAATPDGPRVVQLPFVFLDEERIAFHVARGNAVLRGLGEGEVLFLVTGPDAYISPDWYGLPDQVPTWNYVSVEMQGVPVRMDRDALIAQADVLTSQHEERLVPKPGWTREKMTPGLFEKMLPAIYGYEMRVSGWRGTMKLSQNKPVEARLRVADALEARGKRAMALLMRDLPA